jgi:hypothetical protein
MKLLLSALCLTVLIAPVVQAQSLTREEQKKGVQYLKKTREDLLDATKGLSAAQWNFKPATNKWSAAEIAEHLAASEDFIMNNIQEKVMKGPARTEQVDVKELDNFVLQAIPDRTRKVQAPEPLQPANRFGSPKDSLKHFKESRAKTIEFLQNTKDLRQHAVESPLGKTLDGYQWVLFIGAHSERHTKQLLEVKADPNFPKK